MPDNAKIDAPKIDQSETGYFMTYRHGMNPFCIKGFKIRGDLREARKRAIKHGEIMGYKNIWVIPQFEDLDKVEANRNALSGEVHLGVGELKPIGD